MRASSSPIGRSPKAWRWPRSRSARATAARTAATSSNGRWARTSAGRARSTRAARPSSTSSNAGSTLVPPGAARDRISDTDSTASWSAAIESSSQLPGEAAAASRSRPASGSVADGTGPSLTPGPASRGSRRADDTASPPSAAYCSSSSRWRLVSLVGTMTFAMTWRSPRTDCRRRWGTPRPRSRISVPGCVPGLISTSVSSPSTVGTMIFVPRAAWAIDRSAS